MLQQLPFHAMGCEMLAVIEASSASQLLQRVPEWFEEWEQVLSRFRIDSELTLLNQIHEHPVQVGQTLWDVFQCAHEAEKLTNGLVTPTLLDAIIEAGYDRPFDEITPLTTFAPVPVKTTTPSLTAITVNSAFRTITLPPGMGLDFGGVAKGWAAHKAMERLQVEGPVLIDSAGDIAVSGPRADGSAWQIGVADPFRKGQEIETLFVNGCGIATSGKDRRRWMRDGVLTHHIIDPLTSEPAQTDLLTVTAIAPNVMLAEAAAKASFILGSRAGMEWIDSHPDFAALFILDNGETLYSEKMEEYL